MIFVEWVLVDVKSLLVCIFLMIDDAGVVSEARLNFQSFHSRMRGSQGLIYANKFYVVLATGMDVQVLKHEY